MKYSLLRRLLNRGIICFFSLVFSSLIFFLGILLYPIASTSFASDELPDLTLTNVYLPMEPAINKPTAIFATFSNNSFNPITSVPVRLIDDSGSALTETVVANVGEFEEVNVELDWIPSKTGVYTVAVQIDPDNLITETSELNNYQEITIAVRGPQMTWYVDANIPVPGNGFSADTAFREIGDGLEVAEAGDRVLVAPGHYQGNIRVNAGVTLAGTGADSTIVSASGSSIVVTLEPHSVISGFTILGGDDNNGAGIIVLGGGAVASNNYIEQLDTGIYIECRGTEDNCTEAVTITHNLIAHNGYGIYISHTSDSTPITATLSNNTVADNKYSGVMLEAVTSLLSYNIVADNGQGAIVQLPGGTAKLTQNNLWNNSLDNVGVELGTGTLLLDPLFQDQPEGNYRLSAGSPLRAQVQGTEQDLGAFPFLPTGSRPRSLTINAPDNLHRGLSWQPVTEASGYRVYLGNAPGVYTERYAVENATTFTLPCLLAGVPYYASVSSISVANLESELSIPVAFSLPGIAAGIFEESSPLFCFDGDTWEQVTAGRAAGGGYRMSREPGASVQFAVVGDAFTLLRRVGPDGGRAELTVDGEDLGSIEFYSPVERWQVPATVSGLGAGLHRVSFRIVPFFHEDSSGSTVFIDQLILPAVHTSSDAQRQAIARVNEYRLRTGLPPARQMLAIDAGALAHAEYLAINRNDPSISGLGAHAETPSLPGFTGVWPSDRTRFSGYTGFPGEDVHFLGDPIESVDDWMASVYHRNLILCYGCVDAGYGMVRDSDSRYDVLDMGSYRGVYPPTRQIYTYPVNRQTGVTREWDVNEIPDPLPGKPRPVGYPISLYLVQPSATTTTVESALTSPFTVPGTDVARVQSPEWQFLTAELTDAAGRPVEVYVLDQATDVPKYLPADMVFLIAKHPLTDETTYFVHVAGIDSRSVPFDYRWAFATGNQLEVPDLALSTLTVYPAQSVPGETVTISVAIHNSGPSTRQASVAVTLPSGLTYIAGSANASQGTVQEGAQLFFDLGALNADAMISFEARVADTLTGPTALKVPIDLTWDSGQLHMTALVLVNGLPLYLPSIAS